MICTNEIHKKIYNGMKKACEVVKKTYGPNGRKIIIDNGIIDISCDGYTVLNNIYLEDRIENIGVILLKNAAMSIKDNIGDGTTSTIILITEMCRVIQKYDFMNIDINNIIKIIKNIFNIKINNYIMNLPKSLNDKYMKMLYNICYTVSNDLEITDIICNARKEIVESGTLICRPTFKEKLYYEIHKGAYLERGYVSSLLADNGKIIMNNAYVLILNDDIKNVNELENIIYDIKKTKEDILIIANSFAKEVIDYMIYLKINYKYNICGIISPEYGYNSKEVLEDIATYLNINIITLKNVNIKENYNKAEYIEITDKTTFIRSTNTNINKLNNRIEYLKEKKENEFIRKRISILKGELGIIYIPYNNELDYNLNKEKIVNTINTCEKAINYGVIYGGGITLDIVSKEIIKDIDKIKEDNNLSKVSIEILKGIVETFSIIKEILLGNNYMSTVDENIFDSVYNYTKIINDSLDTLKLFVLIDGYVSNDINNKNDKYEL